MKTNIVRVCEHSFEFLLKGYKGYNFYVSERFVDGNENESIAERRFVLVQKDGKEALFELPFIYLVDSVGFSEDELEDIFCHIERKLNMYYNC